MHEQPKLVSELATERGITEVVHFSTNQGLLGSLHTGLVLPRNRLQAEEQLSYILTLNTPIRYEEAPTFDKSEDWIDYVNLSVSEITTNLYRFSTGKWHVGKVGLFWVILSFEVSILDHEGVYFLNTNNVYEHVIRGKGASGFESLFAPSVRRKGANWRATRLGRGPELTTCEQAEVLYPGGLDVAHLKRVYVSTGENADAVFVTRGLYGASFEVINDATKFAGRPN